MGDFPNTVLALQELRSLQDDLVARINDELGVDIRRMMEFVEGMDIRERKEGLYLWLGEGAKNLKRFLVTLDKAPDPDTVVRRIQDGQAMRISNLPGQPPRPLTITMEHFNIAAQPDGHLVMEANENSLVRWRNIGDMCESPADPRFKSLMQFLRMTVTTRFDPKNKDWPWAQTSLRINNWDPVEAQLIMLHVKTLLADSGVTLTDEDIRDMAENATLYLDMDSWTMNYYLFALQHFIPPAALKLLAKPLDNASCAYPIDSTYHYV